jgi:hypothetical protein
VPVPFAEGSEEGWGKKGSPAKPRMGDELPSARTGRLWVELGHFFGGGGVDWSIVTC